VKTLLERIADMASCVGGNVEVVLLDAAKEIDALRAKIERMEKQGRGYDTEWFDLLPEGTTHISKIRAVTIPCFGFEARFNAFKYIDGVLFTYRTDSDNEYGMWVEAAPIYRNGVLPPVYPLYTLPGAQPAPSVPVDLITDYLVSISAHVAHQDDPKAQAEIGELLRMLAAAPEAKP
jgi:hypothetical protein